MPRDDVKIDPAVETRLAELVAQYRYDAYGFVMRIFPWGQPHTSLARKRGPEPWQKDILDELSRIRLDNAYRKMVGLDYIVARIAVASGHGVGKSALVAWLILWLMSTGVDTRGVVTANTANQLQTKTWPELGKWLNMALNKHWFDWSTTALTYRAYPEDRKKNWKTDALTVAAENTEAWAGLHNETGTVYIIFDEASGIDAKLWEVAEGAFTDGEPFFLVFGNPTQPDGRFADCFLNDPHNRWHTRHVDSREVSHTNKAHLADIIRQNGLDSDFTRIRVLGQFPTKAYDGYISTESVTEAQNRELFPDLDVALVLAIDVARYGDDETVWCFRQGNDARSIRMQTARGLNNVDVALRTVEYIQQYKPDGIIIESVGPGVGVIDILRSWGYSVLEVHPGAKSANPSYRNIRAEIWSKCRDWIIDRGCLPEADGTLYKQLTSIRYTVEGQAETVLQMESKKDMKDRGLDSPDRADALVLTFAYKLKRKDGSRDARAGMPGSTRRATTDYDEMSI